MTWINFTNWTYHLSFFKLKFCKCFWGSSNLSLLKEWLRWVCLWLNGISIKKYFLKVKLMLWRYVTGNWFWNTEWWENIFNTCNKNATGKVNVVSEQTCWLMHYYCCSYIYVLKCSGQIHSICKLPRKRNTLSPSCIIV